MFFKARLKTSDADSSDFVMGLGITDTTPLDVTDGFFFLKSDGAATMDFLIEKDNSQSTIALSTAWRMIRLSQVHFIHPWLIKSLHVFKTLMAKVATG